MTPEQHQAHMTALGAVHAKLHELCNHLVKLNEEHAKARNPFYQTVMISATVPWTVTYRNRKHIFIYSANALTLTLEDLGTVAVAANTWVNVGFQPGMQIFAQGQVNPVPLYVRQTDEVIP